MPSLATMPKVSVIIPNYNHAAYLPQRIESVLAQTFTDFELIILDDKSPDNSREVINGYAGLNPNIKTVFNTENTGSTFSQWNKGAEMATGEYLWFAESDDYCEPTLLEELVPLLNNNPDVGIAYAQTYLVNEESQIMNSYSKNLEFIYKTKEWEKDFVKPGKEAGKDWLYFHNPIPNASGAIIRKSVYMDIGMADTSMKLNGDWFLYAKILTHSNLAFCAKHLNYFRVHEHTQRHRARATGQVYNEIITINNYLREHIPGSDKNADKAMAIVARWWIGSLFFQKRNADFVRTNWKLYTTFRKYYPWLLPRILYHVLFLMVRFVIRATGLLKLAKQFRNWLFPKKYFQH
ncbi:glycosyltransferase family 2 protein [Owenweeksia hongkongensis]|uniref:glycosyltransferase family 2 protein n=1 Tax=Owenweeksia hongkongensis TaxID=253245 RepID=UPI003A8D7E42